ncbi:T9SS C-terminal target domain-containing protein [Flavobacterium magnum]|uniref:T9SS C-terminal target domain-containing protein n=1 Tax=Flavobacterium magnum TaxID=2162713 RepID=A0A2S0RF64_9FLAO|nr:T9SS type A sorting domain-containing protein [Flavobacterium magnum]AWA30403.1 T9SS C-terminal target domain-containing protein [Flavobacterium magnum]
MKKLYILLFFAIGCQVNAQVIDFPDPGFKTALISPGFGFDTNQDGEIEQSEAAVIENLILTNASAEIYSIEGIEYFHALKKLDIAGHSVSNMDVTSLTNLEVLDCRANPVTSLQVAGMQHLRELYFGSSSSPLTTVDLTDLPALNGLYGVGGNLTTVTVSDSPLIHVIDLAYNDLTSLTITNCPQLTELHCQYNELTNLDLSPMAALTTLQMDFNHFTLIDFDPVIYLEVLLCSHNNFTTLDLNKLSYLDVFFCDGMGIDSVFLKNGSHESTVSFNNSFIGYICCDESDVAGIQATAANQGLNVVINSYCSFVPGGNYFTVAGNVKFDSDNNGCDNADIAIPGLKFNTVSGVTSQTTVPDASGDYEITAKIGTHTITPQIENPAYFAISPPSVVLTFPATASPYTQNFCITPIGTHDDLEITLIPIGTAIPGFDANYKILYKNKGNTVQSGSVSMTFEDAIMDLVNATPTASVQTTNTVSWNFIDLRPFEEKAIFVRMNINTPVENPAVNEGDLLHFTAGITSAGTDESPTNNTAALVQYVYNAMDPNDKICLEGSTVTPDVAGKYVHYMVRFENTGTANAQNVVVKDMIDTAKFDVLSLVPLDGSHPFRTRISDTNKVEFIFENIQLPFDDANNDGYVAFKIKTRPTLVVGNTFSNTASIYFDYNAPVVTNTATTAIQVLGTSDFPFNEAFSIYPNPASEILNIAAKGNILINSVSVYNLLGQLIMVVDNPSEKLDISLMAAGTYILKINTPSGSSATKFIKL